jgi:putative endonuclease
MSYFFYIVRCADNSLYCGVTNNLEKRLKEHNSEGARGAKYVRARRPASIEYHENYSDKSSAMKREYEVKQWTKERKESLVSNAKR